MTRFWLAAILGLVACLLLVGAAQAARPPGGNEPLTFTLDWTSVGCTVEQQTIYLYGIEHRDDPCPGPFVVNNPTVGTADVCAWTVDDAQSYVGSGSVDKDTSTSASLCLIVDGTHWHMVEYSVSAPTSDLVVTFNGTDVTPVPAGNRWLWTLCQYAPISGPFASIPDSNGGYGRRTDWTLMLSSPGRTTRSVSAMLKTGVGIHGSHSCGLL